ncbi:MAG: hypothetical protein H7288_11000 [Kineosporiaceae bacterium]|nr:hypothetical protein [Aeromicrobium sp.]
MLTADEDDRRAANKVLTIVVHPSLHSKVVTTPLTHYSLSRLFEEVAGTKYPHYGATARSMRKAFGLTLAPAVTATSAQRATPS